MSAIARSSQENALSTALCLPTVEIEALLQGRTLVAISSSFRNPPHFLLCPVDLSLSGAQMQTRYRPNFWHSLRFSHQLNNPDVVSIQAWAQCKTCRTYSLQDDLPTLSKLTVWSTHYLHELAQAQHKFFLVLLQIHRFNQPIELLMEPPSEEQLGRYITVPGAWSKQNTIALIDDNVFASRQEQLIKLVEPQHLALESLQTELVAIRENSLGAMLLDRDIRYWLGWSRVEETQLYDSDLAWIRKITQANESKAGNELQVLVQKSLLKLGFSHSTHDGTVSKNTVSKNIEAAEVSKNIEISKRLRTNTFSNASEISETAKTTEVASNLNISFDAPYAVVGVCKVSKHNSVSNTVVQQLNRLAMLHSSYIQQPTVVKVLFVAGPLTDLAQKNAKRNKMNVMRPETLQRLSELKAQHPGAIDLFKLKLCLQQEPHGEAADEKINAFVDEILQQLSVRAALIQAVKQGMQRTAQSHVSRDVICAAYAARTDRQLPHLSIGEIDDVLIELSSPIAGYLGRVSKKNGQDAFYLLRELSVKDAYLAMS
jgi:hypothetical protein